MTSLQHPMRPFLKWLLRILIYLGVSALVLGLANWFVQNEVAALRNENPTSTALIKLRVKQAQKAKIAYPTRMSWKSLEQISPNLIHAVLLAEDDRFYDHNGFDLGEIKEAIRINWKKKRYAYGGSTITQQLARTLYLSPKKSIFRKALEAYLTYHLENELTKNRILELYLNVAEWGKGIYGAEAAAQFYFAKSAGDLTPDESVALTSILPSPRRWSPVGEQAFMARRRSRLLQRMERAGFVHEPELPIAPDTFVPEIPSVEPESETDELQGVLRHEAPAQIE